MGKTTALEAGAMKNDVPYLLSINAAITPVLGIKTGAFNQAEALWYEEQVKDLILDCPLAYRSEGLLT